MSYQTLVSISINSTEKSWIVADEIEDTVMDYLTEKGVVDIHYTDMGQDELEVILKDASRLFEDVVITMRGEGEAAEDIWMVYACNGELQDANLKIVFDPCKFINE